MIKKIKRVMDDELLEKTRRMQCLICGDSPCDPDHITTRGAGGGDWINVGDELRPNVWPLCRAHHREWRDIGIVSMVGSFSQCRKWLERNGRTDVLAKIDFKTSFK